MKRIENLRPHFQRESRSIVMREEICQNYQELDIRSTIV
jgi:hypothetical protein